MCDRSSSVADTEMSRLVDRLPEELGLLRADTAKILTRPRSIIIGRALKARHVQALQDETSSCRVFELG